MSHAPFHPLFKEDVCSILRISVRTLENYINQGIIPVPQKALGHPMWHPDVFYPWLDCYLRTGNFSQNDETAVEADDMGEALSTMNVCPTAPKKTRRQRLSAVDSLTARQAKILATRPNSHVSSSIAE